MNSNKRLKISAYLATSLDGFIADKNGNLDWLKVVDTPGEDYGYAKFYESVDLIIMGRVTYEKVLSFDPWPYPGKRVIVLSQSLESVCKQAELFKGEIQDLLTQVFSEGVKHIYVDGGVTLSTFLNQHLIDEVTLSLIPILLGSGTKLFSNIQMEQNFTLLGSKTYPSGLVQVRYACG